MKKLYIKFLVWFMRTSFYKTFVLRIIPFLRFSNYYTEIRGNQYHAGYALLKKGDMILTYDKHKLATTIIGGDFSHAAFVVDDCRSGAAFEVVEMTHKNYTHSTFFDICKESDRVVIARCGDFTEEYIEEICKKALSFDGAKYDSQFEFENAVINKEMNLGVEFLYCSELIYQADFNRVLKVNLEDLAGIGRPYLSPTGLYKAENVFVVWDSKTLEPQY